MPRWTGMGTFRIVDSALAKRAVQCPLNAFGATQPPERLAQGATSTPRQCAHALLPKVQTQHSCGWWAPSSCVAGASSRQGRGGVEVPSRLRHGVSLYRLLGGSCVKGPRRLPDIVNLSISNDSCHGKPTTDRPSTSHPKNSLNLQHRRTSSFLYTTQLSGSSLPRTNRILVSVSVSTSIHEIGLRATKLYDSLTTPIPTAKMSSTQAMSDAQVRRYPAANFGLAGVCSSRPRDSISPQPPFLMAAVDEPCSPKPTTYLTTTQPTIWLTATANS